MEGPEPTWHIVSLQVAVGSLESNALIVVYYCTGSVLVAVVHYQVFNSIVASASSTSTVPALLRCSAGTAALPGRRWASHA